MQMTPTHNAQIFAAVMFVAVVCSAGIVQTVAELWRGESPQALEVFERLPTAENLRTFEKRLKEESLVADVLRPWAQYGQFVILGDAGDKALAGREGWLFYRPAYRYLTQHDPVSVSPSAPTDPLHAIVSCHRQLKSRGIHLLVLPVPNKASIHPEMLTRRADDGQVAVCRRTQRLLDRLDAAGIEVVNLFEAFGQAKQAGREKTGQKLYMAQDTHWSPAGAQLAAQAVASHVVQRGWAAPGDMAYRRRPVSIERIGDLVEMLQVPQIERSLGPECYACQQVVDSDTGAPIGNDPEAEILVLGDSFLRVFEQDEPGSAGFVAQLAFELQQSLTSIINDGGGSTLLRQELARRPELLKNKKLVIWEFVERDIREGTEGWQDVPLTPGGNTAL